MTRSKIIFLNLLLLSGSAGLSALALEFAVRKVRPQFDPSGRVEYHYEGAVPLGPRGETRREWKNTGDYDVVVRFNRHGLRDDKDLTTSQASSIFVVGDSFTVGQGINDGKRYSDELERRLKRPVYNVAIPTDFEGYSHLIAYAKSLGAPVRRLVLGVCMENDIIDYAGKTEAYTAEKATQTASPLRRLKEFLTAKVALYSAFTHAVHHNPALKKAAVRAGVITPNIKGMNRHVFSEAVIQSSADRLEKLVGGYQTTVLIIPSRALWIGGNEDVEKRIHERFVEELAKRRFDVIDMKPHFEASGDPLKLHFKNDGHWNEAGHRLAGEILAAHIKKSLL